VASRCASLLLAQMSLNLGDLNLVSCCFSCTRLRGVFSRRKLAFEGLVPESANCSSGREECRTREQCCAFWGELMIMDTAVEKFGDGSFEIRDCGCPQSPAG
jgi:hypothetical protein